jgi:hypothetical protein
LTLVASAACRTNPCKEGTLLLTVTVGGAAEEADELRVEVTTEGQSELSKTFRRTPGPGGGTVEINYPEGYPAGRTSVVTVTASVSDVDVAADTATVVLASRCSTTTVALGATNDDGGSPDATNDGGGSPDATNDDGGAPSCDGGGACVPTSNADPCAVYTIACSTGAPVCQRSGLKAPGMPCPTGVCSMSGTGVACENGSDCTPAGDPCMVGTLACSSGAPACNATAARRADGYPCGANKVCRAGGCVECFSNQACTPEAGPCVSGITSCTSGASLCQPTAPVRAGQSCGTNMVCNGGGSCVACPQGSACTPLSNTCRVGILDCATGAPECKETAQSQVDGLTCAMDRLCAGGACSPAGNWITRGEDSRTSTGGYVYAYTFGGATLEPVTTPTIPFTPSPGGVTGKALAVAGTVPPENPAMNLTTGAGLAFNLTSTGAPLSVAARGSGLQFQAKSAQAIMLKVKAVDIWTNETFPNCSMDPASTVVHRCYQYPQAICTVPGGNVWTLCRFVWSDFKRPVWGTMGDNLPLDASAMTDAQFQTPTVPMGATPLTYSFAIDDVAFVP